MLDMPIREKSPDRLVHDLALRKWKGVKTSSPVPMKYPPELAGTLKKLLNTSAPRIYRWLEDPDRSPLTWPELCEIADELGGTVKVMFSEKHR